MSSSLRLSIFMSFRIMSLHLFLGRPRLRLPYTSAFMILLVQLSSSFLITCPYHLNLLLLFLDVLCSINVSHEMCVELFKVASQSTPDSRIKQTLRGSPQNG